MLRTLSEEEARAIDEIIITKLALETVISPEADLQRDCGADSIDLVEIAMALEECFAIEVPDDAWEEVNTVVDVHAAVGSALALRELAAGD